jgi:hypothetical protein
VLTAYAMLERHRIDTPIRGTSETDMTKMVLRASVRWRMA